MAITTKNLTCIVCPRGCTLTVTLDSDLENPVVSVEGQGCKRGLEYASAEFAHPVRILTTLVKLDGQNDLLPVRSNKPLPKEKLFDCMAAICAAEVKLPVARYDVIIPNICGTGVDIVATKSVG